MQELQEFIGEELHWIRPQRLRLAFELHAGEAVVATLDWGGRARALGTWAGGQYRVGREGWFRPRTLIYDASLNGSSEPIATFTHRGGTLNFPDGRTFLWKKPKGWTTERVWQDAAATVLVRCRPGKWRVPSAVTVQPRPLTCLKCLCSSFWVNSSWCLPSKTPLLPAPLPSCLSSPAPDQLSGVSAHSGVGTLGTRVVSR